MPTQNNSHSNDSELTAGGICAEEDALGDATAKYPCSDQARRCDAAMSGDRTPDPARQRRPGGSY